MERRRGPGTPDDVRKGKASDVRRPGPRLATSRVASRAALEQCGDRKRLLIRNKCDLPSQLVLPEVKGPVVEVSCQTGLGIEALKDAIRGTVWAGGIPSEMLQVMINSRHQDALRRAGEALREALAALRDELSLELVAMELRFAVNAVGEVVGKTTTEDLLDSIFHQFCIGK